MDGEQTTPLEDLVLDALERIDANGWQELDSLCRAHPDVAEALRRRVRKLLDVGLIAPPWQGPDPVPDHLGDFRLIEKIGGGGMGLVYRAEQISLGREVALKIVRPEQLWFGAARERFLREVEIVAGLSHPGIVPVYAVGEEEGVPFFAMERVSGASLGDVIARLRDAQRDPSGLVGEDLARTLAELTNDGEAGASEFFRGRWPDVCLRICREVAEALEHAHRRGVLHRDVKPSNVMITPEGRVMLLDFGLSSSGSSGDSDADPNRLTRTGAAVGSIPYMSPEQIAAHDELDERTDIYSLGVTLYELLTLKLPFDEGTVIALAERIQSGAVCPVAERNPSVSWEVATVVATAMDVDSGRRYATAADLARDLGHALARRPIEARPPSPWLRARRWVQRNPTAAVAALAGFLLFVIAPSLVAWREFKNGRVIADQRDELGRTNTELGEANEALLSGNAELGRLNDELGDANAALADANDALEAALEETEAERARAERHFHRAYGAVETMLERVGWDALRDVPGMERTRRELLSDALMFHEEVLAEGERDASQVELYSRTLQRVGELRTWLNDYAGAAASLRDRKQLLTERFEEDGGSKLELELAYTRYRLAEAYSLNFQYNLAIEEATAAIEIYERLDDGSGANAGVLGRTRIELGNVLQRAGRIAEGRAILEYAAAELQPFVESNPEALEEASALAEAFHTLGTARPLAIVATEADPQEMLRAEHWLLASIELSAQLVESDPSPLKRRELASRRNALGTVYMTQQRGPEARREFEAAIHEFRWLWNTFPGVPMFGDGYATACMNLMTLMRYYGEEGDWGKQAETALEVFEALIAEHPNQRQFQDMRFYSVATVANARLELDNDVDEAIRLGERSLELGRELLDLYADPMIARHQARMRYHMGRALNERLDHAAAVEYVRAAPDTVQFTVVGDWLLHAQHLVVCVHRASIDERLEPLQRGEVVSSYVDEVVDALESAYELGLDEEILHAAFEEPAWAEALQINLLRKRLAASMLGELVPEFGEGAGT